MVDKELKSKLIFIHSVFISLDLIHPLLSFFFFFGKNNVTSIKHEICSILIR